MDASLPPARTLLRRLPMGSASASARTSRGQTPPRIIVAEDDDDLRGIVVEMLAFDGYDVQDVADGTALVRLVTRDAATEHRVRLVVSDVRMPGCTGLQALETVRSMAMDVPFLLMTAFGGEEVHAEAERLGATLLDKPLSMSRLRGVVAGLLESSELA